MTMGGIELARPTKRTEALVGKLEYAFSLGCTVTEACLHAGISRDTYYEWCKADTKLSDRMTELKETPVLIARDTVIKGIKKDPDLALKFLERRKKDEFSTKSEQDINVHLPQPILGAASTKIIEAEQPKKIEENNG